jgi:hypothetical protein
MITYYHRQATDSRFGPGDKLGREMHSRVVHIDLFLGGERIGPKRRLRPEELEQARVRLGVNFELPEQRSKAEPDVWTFVSIRALRHEVRGVWRKLDQSEQRGEISIEPAGEKAAANG